MNTISCLTLRLVFKIIFRITLTSKESNIDLFVQRMRKFDRSALARLITLLESKNDEKREIASQVIKKLEPFSSCFKIGVTGSPGVGKSSFIDSYGYSRLKSQKTICSLTVDPSSSSSMGSILGDKTRMERLSLHERAFVRSTPSGSQLGGITDTSFDAIRICEAFGFDEIYIETVGVGQSELDIEHISDVVIYLAQPGSGDELQGIKKGVLEIADIIVVNKCDGVLLQEAKRTQKQFQNTSSLMRPKYGQWKRPVLSYSSMEDEGIVELEEAIIKWKAYMMTENKLFKKRAHQKVFWFEKKTKKIILKKYFSNFNQSKKLVELSADIESGNISLEEAIRNFTTYIDLQ